MAARTNRVEVEIVATDEASPKIDKLEKKIDGLESDEARIIVTSNIERLDSQLSDALYKLHQLDGDEATVQARLVGGLEDDLIAAKKLFDQLDGKTGTVRLDTSGATEQVKDLGKSADSSRSALANMVGNSAQDIGQLGGVAGSTGVAIGQMAEYASDAALAGEGLGVALGNMVKVAGPIAALAFAVGAINEAISKQADLNKLAADNQKRWNDALESGTGLSDAFVASLADLHKITVDISGIPDLSPGFRDKGFTLKSFFNVLDTGRKQTVDAADAFRKAGIDTTDLADAAANGAEGFKAYTAGVQAARDAGRINADEQKILIAALEQQADALNKARDARRQFQSVFNPKVTRDDTTALAAYNTQVERYLESLTGSHEAEIVQHQADARRAANRELEAYLDLLTRRGNEAADMAELADQTHRYFSELARVNTEAERVDRARMLNKESDAARAAATEYSTLFGELDEQAAKLRIVKAFEDARDQLTKGNLTLVDAGLLLNGLKQDVADYAATYGKVPPSLTTQLLVDIDTLNLTDAEKTLLGYQPAKAVTVPVIPQVVRTALTAGATADQLERIAASVAPPRLLPAPANVTIINPPGTPAATADNYNVFVSRNGVRSQL